MVYNRRCFGRNVDDWPTRFSNIRLSRLQNGEKMGCSYCFPHGIETMNTHWRKDLRCWKRYRQQQWRETR